jgi:hypothetical protein
LGSALSLGQTEGICLSGPNTGFISSEQISSVITIPAKLHSWSVEDIMAVEIDAAPGLYFSDNTLHFPESFNEILNELFPYNFGFKVFKPLNRQNILTPNYDEAPSTLYGYDDSQIKSKLHFDQYKRDHAINFAIEQGGENTYYYFLIADQEGNEYVGTFGFKDQGDVDSSYVTRFIAFLMECYGLPFEVKHSVMAKGGITKDFSGNYYSTNDFVQQNGLEEEAVKVFGEDWEAEDDVDQIAELANHMGLKYVIKYAETRNQWNKLRQIDTYHKTPDSEYDIFVISNENWKKYLNK